MVIRSKLQCTIVPFSCRVPPLQAGYFANIFEDRRGDIRLGNFDERTLLRHTVDTVISYPVDGHVTHEGADGTLYAYASNGYFRIDRTPSGQNGNPVAANRTGNPFAVRVGNLIVNCALAHSGRMSIDCHSLQGVLLKTHLNGYQPRGSHRIRLPLGSASGVIIRVRPPHEPL